MIPTLPENAEGGAKSTPPVHPNAPLPLFGTAVMDKRRSRNQKGSPITSPRLSWKIHLLINYQQIYMSPLKG